MGTENSSTKPHLGRILEDLMKQRRYTINQLAYEIGVSPMLVWRLLKEQDFHSKYIWKLSNVFGINLFQTMANAHPVQTATPKETELQRQVDDLQRRVEIYKEIVKGN